MRHGAQTRFRARHGLFFAGVVCLYLSACAGLKSDLDAPDNRPLWKRALRPAWVARSPRWVQVLWYSGPGH